MLADFYRRRSFRIMLMVVFLFPIIGFGALRAVRQQRNNVEEWLPSGYTETDELDWFREHFLGEQFALVSWEGCTRDDTRLHVLARKLVPGKEEFAARKEASQRANTDRVLAALRPPTTEMEPLFKRVVTGASVVEQMTAPPLALDEAEALDRLQNALIKITPGADGQVHEQTCLVVTLTDFGKRHLKLAVDEIRHQAENSGLSQDELRMGGPPVDNYAIDAEGKKTLARLAGWSGLIGLLLAYWCFRSIRLTIMVFSIGLCSAITALGLVGYWGMIEVLFLGRSQAEFGGVDAVLMSMPSLVYVLGISGAIHIINYYHDAVREGGEDGAAAAAIAHGWKPCTLAAFTTAIGLLSLCISDLVPIRKFGFWSAMGVLSTLTILFTMLPAWLTVWRPKVATAAAATPAIARRRRLDAGWHWLGEGIIRRSGWVSLACAGIMVFFLVGLTRTTTSVQLLKLFDPGSRIIADYTWLEQHLGNLVPMELVVRVDTDKTDLSFVERMEMIERVQETIEGMEPVDKTLSAVTFAPPRPDKEDFSKGQRRFGILGGLAGSSRFQHRKALEMYNERIVTHRAELIDGDYLSQDGPYELWRISCRVSALNDVDYGQFVDELKQAVEPVVGEFRHGEDPMEVTYTGVVPLVYKSQRELLHGLIESIGTSFLLISIVMVILLRSARAGLLAMLPNLFPVSIIFGMMGWLDISVDIGSMMTASVALGIAVDDTIHFLTWFRHGIKDLSLTRREAVMLAYERCARAMLQTTAVGGLGLLVFALSSFTPTQRFGYLMFTLLCAALVGDLVFLPALLCSPLGRFFEKHSSDQASVPAADRALTESPAVAPAPHIETAVPGYARVDTGHVAEPTARTTRTW